jgi:ParB family transcriptional regulator, chromosome partitioning protein
MSDKLLELPLDQIVDAKLPIRRSKGDDRIRSLMQSIQRYGVIEPILVTPVEKGYELVSGRRRLEACRRLKRPTVPVVVRRLSSERARELSFQSNLQAEPLSIADEVDYLRKAEVFQLPDEVAALRVGMTAAEVAVARRFNRLPPSIREAVRAGDIDERRALALTRLSGEADQNRVFRHIQQNDPPIEVLEDLVTRIRSGEAPQI